MPKTEPKNSFVLTLNEIQNGGCVSNLSEKLAELIDAVKTRNATGELALKLKFKPSSGGEQIIIIPTITMKKPAEIERGTIFYPTEDNTLQRNDPNQRTFDLQEVPREEAATPRAVEQEKQPLRAVNQ